MRPLSLFFPSLYLLVFVCLIFLQSVSLAHKMPVLACKARNWRLEFLMGDLNRAGNNERSGGDSTNSARARLGSCDGEYLYYLLCSFLNEIVFTRYRAVADFAPKSCDFQDATGKAHLGCYFACSLSHLKVPVPVRSWNCVPCALRSCAEGRALQQSSTVPFSDINHADLLRASLHAKQRRDVEQPEQLLSFSASTTRIPAEVQNPQRI